MAQNRPALDTERVAAARQALGPERMLFVDVRLPQRPVTWERSRTEAYMRALAPFQVRYIEEPALTYNVEGTFRRKMPKNALDKNALDIDTATRS